MMTLLFSITIIFQKLFPSKEKKKAKRKYFFNLYVLFMNFVFAIVINFLSQVSNFVDIYITATFITILTIYYS